MDEVAVLHFFRAFRDWLQKAPVPQDQIMGMEIVSGSYQTVKTISRWLEGKVLSLETPAASLILGDLKGPREWLRCDLYLTVWNPPEDIQAPEDMPWKYQLAPRTSEEFRIIAAPVLGAEWGGTLPELPMNKSDVENAARFQQEQD